MLTVLQMSRWWIEILSFQSVNKYKMLTFTCGAQLPLIIVVSVPLNRVYAWISRWKPNRRVRFVSAMLPRRALQEFSAMPVWADNVVCSDPKACPDRKVIKVNEAQMDQEDRREIG